MAEEASAGDEPPAAILVSASHERRRRLRVIRMYANKAERRRRIACWKRGEKERSAAGSDQDMSDSELKQKTDSVSSNKLSQTSASAWNSAVLGVLHDYPPTNAQRPPPQTFQLILQAKQTWSRLCRLQKIRMMMQ